jgi:hypothetical protein
VDGPMPQTRFVLSGAWTAARGGDQQDRPAQCRRGPCPGRGV